ncbi:MAG: ABC transporter ATP-binding protein [Candidatus Neomarinimicrobiota bacterium]|nr:MAG: ABC transporter ATP-binding protein [Candidatus Neomarinimicrobiota bacterium]
MLQAIDIHKSYRNGRRALPVLQGINLELEPGQILTIMGPSGSGKSTLLNILGTLDRPDQGQILYRGENLSDLAERDLARFRNEHLGFVFQFHHLLPEFTAEENALMPAEIGGRTDRRSWAEELFDLMGLTERRHHYPHELSGGERQRVALIRALINRPQIVLADEPTGNLDQKNAQIILNLFVTIQKRFHQSIVITTHNPDVAAVGERQYELQNGTLAVTGSI